MALPDDLTTVTITGIIGDARGNVLTSPKILFTPDVERFSEATDGYLGYGVPFEATIDPAAGTFSVDVVASDDVDMNPTGWSYKVTVSADNLDVDDVYWIVVAEADAPTTPITALMVASPPQASTSFKLSDLSDAAQLKNATDGQMPAFDGASQQWKPIDPPSGGGGGSGTVQKVAGVSPDGSGNVSLSAANVGAIPVITSPSAGKLATMTAAGGLQASSIGLNDIYTGVLTVARNTDNSWSDRPTAGVVVWLEMNPSAPLCPAGMIDGDFYDGPDGMTGVAPGGTP